jgi:hypothetical protein
VVLNKSDVTTPSKRKLKLEHDLLISAVAQRNVKSLVRAIGLMLEQMERENPASSTRLPRPPPHEEEDGEPDPGSDD